MDFTFASPVVQPLGRWSIRTDVDPLAAATSAQQAKPTRQNSNRWIKLGGKVIARPRRPISAQDNSLK